MVNSHHDGVQDRRLLLCTAIFTKSDILIMLMKCVVLDKIPVLHLQVVHHDGEFFLVYGIVLCDENALYTKKAMICIFYPQSRRLM